MQLKWIPINTVVDESVRKFLGKEYLALRGDGYYATYREFNIFILEVGNGFVINFHPNPYIVAVVKKSLSKVRPNLISEAKELEEMEKQRKFLKELEGYEGEIIYDKKLDEKYLNAIHIYSMQDLINFQEREILMDKAKLQIEKVLTEPY